MNAVFVYNLKNPCSKRGIELISCEDGNVLMDGKSFDNMKETETYIESKPVLEIFEKRFIDFPVC